VVEVEVDHAAVVSADGAAATRLGDQDALDLLETPRDSLSDAALAAPTDSSLACPIAMKNDQAMTSAAPQLGGAVGLRRSPLLWDQRRRGHRVYARH
jgi:hypothetical protein